MTKPSSTTPRRSKPRFTKGSVTRKGSIWTAGIDELRRHWWSRIVVHGDSEKEVVHERTLILKAISK